MIALSNKNLITITNKKMSQQIGADPGINQPYLVNNEGNTINPNQLKDKQQAKLRLGIFASNFFDEIPSDCTQIRINLGKHAEVVGDVTNSAFAEKFKWTVTKVNDATIILGDQEASLQKDFNATLEFNVVFSATPTEETVVAEWVVTDKELLNDFQVGNNYSTMKYSVAASSKETVIESPTTTTATPTTETTPQVTSVTEAQSKTTPKTKKKKSLWKRIKKVFGK